MCSCRAERRGGWRALERGVTRESDELGCGVVWRVVCVRDGGVIGRWGVKVGERGEESGYGGSRGEEREGREGGVSGMSDGARADVRGEGG